MKKDQKTNVVVLMGGRTPEYEISLLSGIEVVRNLSPEKYNALPVIISRDGTRWQLTAKALLLSLPNPLKNKDNTRALAQITQKELAGINEMDKKPDVVFIAMHGPYGEDGTVQGLLELTGVRYTGSGVLASAIGMDKITFRKLMKAVKISTPKYIVVKKGQKLPNIKRLLGPPPYFVKPSNQGSSVGGSIVRQRKNLQGALDLASQYGDIALVDKYVSGTELTCGVLGNENPKPLPVVEIIPGKEFFDYESKYTHPKTQEIVPARISPALSKKVQDLALKVYKEVGARGFARIDFILRNNKEPVVLEINTIPGLTPMSLLPKAAAACGISYPQLLDTIIQYALE